MPLDTFFKLSAEDPEAQCNVITPLNPNDLKREINPRTGRVITEDDRTAAKRAFTRIAHARGAMVGVCCDPSSNYKEHDKKVLADLRAKYPSARLVKNNAGDIVEIELSRVTKPVVKGWRQISPYLVCRILNATLYDDPNDTDVVRAKHLTKDCYTENCDTTDALTLEALFGSMPSTELEYTAYDDSRVSRAVLEGDASYVEEYLRKYNRVNQPLTHNDYRERILHLAARAGYSQKKHQKVMDLVIAVRPQLDVKNYQGNTPMHIATANGQVEVVERLIKYGGSSKAGVNARNNRGETPLMLAAAYHSPTHAQDTADGRTHVVFVAMSRLLYNNGANIIDVDNNGNNILHHIILNSPNVREKAALVRYFIERGANGEQRNNDGATPLELVGTMLGDYSQIDPEAEESDEDKEAKKWITHEGFQSREPVNYPRYNSVKGTDIKFKTDTRTNVTNDFKRSALLAIQTILFNDHIRQHPDKYTGPVNVKEIPRGAPIIVRHYMCSADGSTDNPSSALHDIDTRDECEGKGGQWVKIKQPTTLVQLNLIPEGDSYIDEVPPESLYGEKYPQQSVYKPLPEEVQKLNSEVRSPNYNSSTNTRPVTLEGREGFEDMNGEYVSRGPMPGLPSATNVDELSDMVGEPHPSICRGIKAQAEVSNARMRTEQLLANNFRNSRGVRNLGQFVKENYMLMAVLLVLIFIFLWQLAKCHL